MRYEDLDNKTRRWMLEEFHAEEAGNPYRSPALSKLGRERFPALMEAAISDLSESLLESSLRPSELWNEFEPAPRGGVRPTDPARAARELARQEFNTWYVRGLCRRVMEDGEILVQVYRAGDFESEDDECDALEGKVLEARFIYNGHRAKYWPSINTKAFSIPSGARCRHSVRRVPPDMRAMLDLEERQFGAAFRR